MLGPKQSEAVFAHIKSEQRPFDRVDADAYKNNFEQVDIGTVGLNNHIEAQSQLNGRQATRGRWAQDDIGPSGYSTQTENQTDLKSSTSSNQQIGQKTGLRDSRTSNQKI